MDATDASHRTQWRTWLLFEVQGSGKQKEDDREYEDMQY
jgi:phage terminase large subunit-like protein